MEGVGKGGEEVSTLPTTTKGLLNAFTKTSTYLRKILLICFRINALSPRNLP